MYGQRDSHRELWIPSEARIRSARLTQYMDWLASERDLRFANYDDLWKWSVGDMGGFWQSIWDYFDVIASNRGTTPLAHVRMPNAIWFPEARLNWAENLLRWAPADELAVIGLTEEGEPNELTWSELRDRVANLAARLRDLGVRPGDRVAVILPNCPEAVISLLACASTGGIWSCCPPDFGVQAVIDRFAQIEPKVLIGVDGYRFTGRRVKRTDVLQEIRAALPSVEHLVVARRLDPHLPAPAGAGDFSEYTSGSASPVYEQVPFEHPLWILYSSGTTGAPKGIVHSHGGILLESLKANALHYDLRPGDRVFIAASTAWVLWNMLVDAMSVGATIIAYDGSPTYPGRDRLFDITSSFAVARFGTGAAYLALCEREGICPRTDHDFPTLRTIMTTGSPLPPSTWQWVYDCVKRDLLLGSDSGGTDVATAFFGTNPILPVRTEECQAAYLGVLAEAWDESGHPTVGQVGELVIGAPMPSMPVSFWNDPDGRRYHESYFEMFPGKWRHGDWVTVTERGSFLVHGRSDSTLNRGGIRMGSADLYRVVETMAEIDSSMVVGVELPDGGYYMPLFVHLSDGTMLTEDLIERVRSLIRAEVSPRHVPDQVIEAPGIPLTRTGKKLEVPVKRLLQGTLTAETVNREAAADTAILDWYVDFAAKFRT